MSEKKEQKNKQENGWAKYAHLPRARDYKLPEEISPELKEAMEATREAMEALRLEEEKYGKKLRF
jgi:GH25 family lysozyme M1 (1,4-beta-N-acetylmuramidase)